MFTKGIGIELLDAAGIPYGTVELRGFEDLGAILTHECGKSVLKSAVEVDVITADQAEDLDRQMVEAGLFVDCAAVYKKFIDFVVPDGEVAAHTFKVCECGMPIPHGNVVTADAGDVVNGPAFHMEQLLSVAASGVAGGHCTGHRYLFGSWIPGIGGQ